MPYGPRDLLPYINRGVEGGAVGQTRLAASHDGLRPTLLLG